MEGYKTNISLYSGFTAIADITGAYSMAKFNSGTFNFEVSATSYAGQTVMLQIAWKGAQ